jgi:hypothetical protein
MSKKQDKEIITSIEIHNKLEACINCEHELECTDILPFPDNLCDTCIKYKKRSINL